MAKGDTFPPEKLTSTSLTIHDNIPVVQLTAHGTHNFCQYFTHTSWRRDTGELVFTSDRSGGIEFYSVHPETGIITQLTEGANASAFGWAISHDGEFLIYYGGEAGAQEDIHRVWLRDLENEHVLTRPERYKGWTRSIISLSPDKDTFFVDGCANADTLLPSNLFKGSLSEGSFNAVFPREDERENFYCHNILCPTNPTILHVNKSPAKYIRRDAPQRMWLLDTESGILQPLYKHKTNIFGKYERVGHECWHPSGKYMVFVVRRNKVKACTVSEGHGNKQSWTCGKGPNFWHVSASPSGEMLCADSMWDDSGLWLIEFKESERGRIFNLCLTGSKWQSNEAKEIDGGTGSLSQAHPHPGWSHDGTYVNFTSFRPKDRAVQLYIMKVPKKPFDHEIP